MSVLEQLGLSALAGGGAGLLQLPALIFLGLSFPVALATHKIASVALGVGASLRHVKQSTFEAWRLALILATGLPGVVLGALLALEIPPRAGRGRAQGPARPVTVDGTSQRPSRSK